MSDERNKSRFAVYVIQLDTIHQSHKFSQLTTSPTLKSQDIYTNRETWHRNKHGVSSSTMWLQADR